MAAISQAEFMVGIEMFNLHLSPREKRILSAEIASLEKDGVVQKRESDYHNQIFLNEDPNDPYKLVVDLSRLNVFLDKYNFVPKPKRIWPNFLDKKYISTLKVDRAYYQIALSAEQQRFTGFNFDQDHYVFTRLTPGVYGCEDMLQGLMLCMFKDMLYDKIFVYLETVYVFGETEDEHRRNLNEALKRLKGGSMKAKIVDNLFYQPSVELLGYKISNNELQMLDEKLKLINETECPKTLTELLELMRAARFYKEMIKGFASLAAPLTEYFDQPQPLAQDLRLKIKHKLCIEALKKQLLLKPVLAIFDQKAETILNVSASKIAIEGDLYQVDPKTKKKRAVGYFSDEVVGGKKNWDLFDLEMLAIAESFQYFEEYLKKCPLFSVCQKSSPQIYSQHFQIPTDRLKKLKSRICRYGFNFRHVCDEEDPTVCFSGLVIANVISK